MAVHKSYVEAVKQSGNVKHIFTDDKFFYTDGSHYGVAAVTLCQPADHLTTLAQFHMDGYDLALGDSITNGYGDVLLLDDREDVNNWNEPDEDDYEIFVIEAAALKGINYKSTKWDARGWTEEQKRAWQQRMFELGYGWPRDGRKILNLDAAHYFINENGILGYGRGHEQSYFDECEYAQMVYTGAFASVGVKSVLPLDNAYVLNLTGEIGKMIEDGQKTVRLRTETAKQLLEEVIASRGLSLPVYHPAKFDAPWKAAKAVAHDAIVYRKDGDEYKRVETEQEACSFWDELFYE